ncbi:MAG: SH3 domain-containing protein [Flavobacteriales bacterium]|nr:SH3 domain-containing protein [Flavobacteriales bacterium]
MKPYLFFMSWVFTIICWLVILTSCGKKLENSHIQLNQADSLKQESEEIIYYVWVDNLRVRKKPGKDGEVIRELKNMEKLIYLNEKSDFTEEVILRGQLYNEPWLKVKLPEGKIGWVYGGGVTTNKQAAIESDEWLIRPGIGVGRIRIGETIRDVQVAYGKEQVKKQRLFIPEGETREGFVVFPKQSNQLECFIDNSGKIELIRITGKLSSWHTVEGIRIGTTLDELVELNGKPIHFSGFGWDYDGAIISYNQGKLDKLKQGLDLTLAYPDEGFPNYEKYLGDQIITSNIKDLKGVGIIVNTIMVFSKP